MLTLFNRHCSSLINLPAKCVQEAQKHRQEYEEMVAQARKREVKEAEKRKKKMKERSGTLYHNLLEWDLWWQGIPPSVRDKVWSLAIGNDLNITHELYEIFLSRAMEKWKRFEDLNMENGDAVGADRENSLELIKLDISRTFPTLCIFQKGGPYHNVLQNILGVQGMSFIAAVLLLNLNAADAFVVFANLLNKPCQLAFFRVDHGLMLKYYAAFEVFFEENLPNLFAHFKKYNLTPDIYLIDWIFTLYSKSLPLDVACRVWDVFCRDGEEFLFRTAIAILLMFEEVLLRMDFIHMAQMLTRLPENLSIDELFTAIAAVQLQSRNKKWGQVLATLQRDWRESGESSRNSSPNRQ
uniref:TBC1 domain family, member 14 n=1 Tax=Eptatretus burgeri TaxID=7764 RepID=A0A8C4QI17_EPTBU